MLYQPLFNFHDVVLILICIEALLFSLILVSVKLDKPHSRLFLSLFLSTKALVAFDTLIYWCVPLKFTFFSNQYFLFFVFKFALLIQGPFLYFYVKSLIYSDFKLIKKDILHLVPFLLFPILLLLIFHDIGETNLYKGIDEYNFYFESLIFRSLLNLQSLSIFIYSVLCLRLLLQYRKKITARFSNLDSVSLAWIGLLVFAYLIIWAWEITAQIAHLFDLGDLAALIGVTKNYIELIFINLLVLYSVAKAAQPTAFINEQDCDNLLENAITPNQDPKIPTSTMPEFNEEDIAIVLNSMTEQELFLEHDINIEKLSEKIGLSPRIVSKIINHHCKKNFFEFINCFRVEKAKNLLESSKNLSMLDVMDLSGFNSKATFNRLFKKQTGLTPSQFRAQHSAT